MKPIWIAALVAAACLGASGARAQTVITDGSGRVISVPGPTPPPVTSRQLPLSPQASSDFTSIQMAAGAVVLSAASGYVRLGWLITSHGTDTSSAGDTVCSDDGTAATTSHGDVVAYGRTATPNPPGVPVSQAAITCIGSAAVTVTEWRAAQ